MQKDAATFLQPVDCKGVLCYTMPHEKYDKGNFIQSSNDILLSSYSVPSSISGVKEISVNKTEKSLPVGANFWENTHNKLKM